jgi:hypothetical protein
MPGLQLEHVVTHLSTADQQVSAYVSRQTRKSSNACINGATIEVVGDPRPSSRDVNRCGQLFETNFRITGLQQGASVTLRVAAEGYTTRDFPMVIEGDLDDLIVVALKLQKR